jgi:hypothetical protein
LLSSAARGRWPDRRRALPCETRPTHAGPCAELGSFACGGPVARAPTRCRYPGRCHARAR